MAKKAITEEVEEVKFTKEQILQSKRYRDIEKDILKALLEEITYSLCEVDRLLEGFNKKEVK